MLEWGCGDIMMQEILLNQLNPNSNLTMIQDYLKQIIRLRGFDTQNVEHELLLLTEEVGELAKAIRKEKTNIGIDKNKITNYHSIEEEIADVFIVLNGICNTLNINLFDAFVAKEKRNINRTWNT